MSKEKDFWYKRLKILIPITMFIFTSISFIVDFSVRNNLQVVHINQIEKRLVQIQIEHDFFTKSISKMNLSIEEDITNIEHNSVSIGTMKKEFDQGYTRLMDRINRNGEISKEDEISQKEFSKLIMSEMIHSQQSIYASLIQSGYIKKCR